MSCLWSRYGVADLYSRDIICSKWYMSIRTCTELAISAISKVYGGWEFLLSAAILLCGLTFTGIANLADVFYLVMFGERCFYKLQKEYLYPVVHTNYVPYSGVFSRGANFSEFPE